MHNHDVADADKAVAAGTSASSSSGDGSGAVDGAEEISATAAAAEARASAQEILLALPGVNPQNYRELMHRVENLRELSKMTEAELAPILGPQNAKKLVTFFRQRIVRDIS